MLRTAGKTLRSSGGTKDDEEMLIATTLRNMNLSKLVNQDVPLFMDLLDDTFPGVALQDLKYPEEKEILRQVIKAELTPHPSWILKIV